MAEVPKLTEAEVAGIVPQAKTITFLSDGGQKRVFKCEIGGQPWVLKFMLIGDAPTTPDPEDELDASFDSGAEVLARAQREVDTMTRCDCPSLVKLGPIQLQRTTHAGQDLIYFSEEYIDGDSLYDALRKGGRLLLAEAVQMALDVTDAVQALWDEARIHRDIKPGNIMRRSNGRFVLLDVGMAFDLGDESITGTGLVVGTPAYFSPEQMNVANKRQLDFRSDLFSLGVTLYQAVTGEHPFATKGSSKPEIFGRIMTATPVRPRTLRSDLPAALDTIIMRLLAKRPHLRYRTCGQLTSALRAVQV
jgi:serine/threonine protein kinase